MPLIPAILHPTLELAAAGISWPVIIGIEAAPAPEIRPHANTTGAATSAGAATPTRHVAF